MRILKGEWHVGSTVKTIVVAFVLCVVCSIMVSTTAVQLKPTQLKNQEIDMKKNILSAAGMMEEGADVEELFKQIETVVVDLETGTKTDKNPDEFDMEAAEKNPETSVKIPADKDIAGLSRRSKLAEIYLTKNESGTIEKVILPVKGKGLWSTMYGFLALESDANTVAGFGYYKQGETPGLGAEVENPKWKAQWVGKKLYDEQGNPAFKVTKNNDGGPHSVDALAGATITGNGVQTSTNYWMSDHAYGKLLENIRGGTF